MLQFPEGRRVVSATTKPTPYPCLQLLSALMREIRNHRDQMVKKSVEDIAEALWGKSIRNRDGRDA